MATTASEFDPNIHISTSLYEKVTNIAELKAKAREGEIRAALINPRMIVSQFQAMLAVNKAIQMKSFGKMITKNVHSEVIYCLSGSKNISDAFRKFGLSDNMTAVLVIEIHEAEKSAMSDITAMVNGECITLDKLPDFTNEADVIKAYKVKEPELKIGTLEEAVAARMASKDFVSY